MAQQISQAVRAVMRPSAASLEPYDPSFSPCRVNLSANENTYGMPAEVRDHVSQALAQVATNRYPKPMSDELRAQIAEWHGVAPEQVIVGNGGDELLFNLFLAFGGSGHTMVDCPPTFSVYRLYAELVETTVRDVRRNPEDFSLDPDELVKAATDASIVVLTSPNNPTGNLVPTELVARVCEACPGVVLADEAYGEFSAAGSSAEPLLSSHPNLVVLHTLSKAYCMAGARVGYLLGSPSVIGALSAVRQPYSVNVLSQAAASVVVSEREAFEPTIARIVSERSRLAGGLSSLERLGVRVWPSEANFLLVRMPDAHRVRCLLRDEHSILVRDFSSTPGLRDCLRVTVGTPAENDEVVSAISQILSRED